MQKSLRMVSAPVCILFNSLPRIMLITYSNKPWQKNSDLDVSKYFYLFFPLLLEHFGISEAQKTKN